MKTNRTVMNAIANLIAARELVAQCRAEQETALKAVGLDFSDFTVDHSDEDFALANSITDPIMAKYPARLGRMVKTAEDALILAAKNDVMKQAKKYGHSPKDLAVAFDAALEGTCFGIIELRKKLIGLTLQLAA